VLPFRGTGHINPLVALGQELLRRGHRVTFFERPKIRDRIVSAGLGFVPVCADRGEPASPLPLTRSGIAAEIAMLRFNLQRVAGDVEQYLRETPRLLREAGIDALIVDEIALAGPTIAQCLGLPYFLLSTSVPHNCGWGALAWLSGHRYIGSAISALEIALLDVSATRVRGPLRRRLQRARKRAGLGPLRTLRNSYPPLAQITQLPRCLDFPHAMLPANCHYAGPLTSREPRFAVNFPWSRLDGRPLAYVTLGTTRNAQPELLRTIAEACQDFDLQLVISLGGRFRPEDFAALPGRPVVVAFAPQAELLRRARIVITHAGANTVFETLLEGKPMVAIPLAHDQPAMAARVARAGAAKVLPVMRLSTPRVRAAVAAVLHDSAYGDAAAALQEKLRAIDGPACAAQIIEESLAGHAADQAIRVTASRDPIASFRSL
jgi:MGT family glycosyltransferase